MKRLNLKEFFSIFKYIKPNKPLYFTILALDSVTEITFYLLMPVVMKLMIDASVQESPDLLRQGLILTLVTSGFGMISFVSLEYFLFSAFYKTRCSIMTKLYDRILKLPVSYLETHHSGDTLSRLNNDVHTMQDAYGWPLRMLVVSLLSGFSSAIMMLFLDWRVSILLIIVGLVSVMLNAGQAKEVRSANEAVQKSMGIHTETLANVIGGFLTLKSLGFEQEMLKKAKVINQDIMDNSLKLSRRNAVMESRNFLFGSINFVGVVILASFLAMRGVSSLGSVVSLVYLLGNVNRMFEEINGMVLRVQGALAGSKRVTELLETEIEPETIPVEGTQDQDAMIALEQVNFSYREETQTLDNVSLSIQKGQVAAFVGPSGGGKSTIMKLILGYYHPTSGRMTINGKAVRDMTISQLRSIIAYVPQDCYIFDGTVEDNIRLGRPDATQEEILQATKAANADEFIMNMEQGYQTLVGERGVRLSGGQRQRIAISRAFLKDALILLLDEATSSLDSQSEQQVQGALENLMKNKTVLVIAHRLSTIENADIIYLVDEGKIVESGTHEGLLKNKKLYHRLHQIQFSEGEKGSA